MSASSGTANAGPPPAPGDPPPVNENLARHRRKIDHDEMAQATSFDLKAKSNISIDIEKAEKGQEELNSKRRKVDMIRGDDIKDDETEIAKLPEGIEDKAFNDIIDLPISTNKHPKLAENLGGPLAVGRALTELLTNAFDAARHLKDKEPRVTVKVTVNEDQIPLDTLHTSDYSKADKIQIVIKNRGEPMLFTAFREKPNSKKQEDRTATGKFGVGLNDAMAQLAYYNLSYEATSGNRKFQLLSELQKGCVCVQQNKIDAAADDAAADDIVTTVVTWSRDTSKVRFKKFDNPKQLLGQLADALESCWAWLVYEDRLKEVWSDRLGVVAEWRNPDDAFRNYIFVHGKRYDTGATSYRGFAFAYNLLATKTAIIERERLRPHNTWPADAKRLCSACMKALDEKPKYGHSATLMKLFAKYKKQVNEKVKPCWEMTNDISDNVLKNIIALTGLQKAAADVRKQREEDRDAAQRKVDEAKATAVLDDDDDVDVQVLYAEFALSIAQMTLNGAPPVTMSQKVVVKNLPTQNSESADSEPYNSEPGISDECVFYKNPTRPLGAKVLKASKSDHVALETDEPNDTCSDRDVRNALAGVCTTLAKMCQRQSVHINICDKNQDTAINGFWDAHARGFDVRRSETEVDVENRVIACLKDLQHSCEHDFATVMAKTELASSKGAEFTVPRNALQKPNVFRPMLIIDDWGSATGGIAAFNFQLACDLSSFGAKADNPDIEVYVLITNRKAMPLTGSRPPNIVFVGLDDQGRPEMFEERAATVTTLIGHGHVNVGKTFADIAKKPNFEHCSKWMFLHTTPDRVETAKLKEEVATTKNAELSDMAKGSDIVFPVGEYMYDYWENTLDVPISKFTPELNSDFVKAARPAEASDSSFIMCCIGRVSGVLHSKGLDILKNVLDCLKEGVTVRPHLIIRGIKDQSYQDARLNLNFGKDDVFVSIRGFGDHSKVQSDLRESHLFLMPSIVEPFGLSGLEAIASGVVPLMSSESGLARHIQKFCVDDKKSGCTDAYNLIIDDQNEANRVNAWCNRVKKMRDMRKDLPNLADRIKKRLAKVESTAGWLHMKWTQSQ